MNVIEQQQWQEVSILTWGELLPHQWIDFRIALMETETEQGSTGVVVKRSYTTATVTTELETTGVKIVQSPIVIQTRTEMVVSIVVSERDYKSEMNKYLPLYERKSGVFNEALTAYDREFRNAEQRLEVTERNIFLDTAIESLPLSERDLGIETVKNLRYDQRREQIYSRYRASFDQTTEETIKSVASAYSNGEVDVRKTDVPGVFEIKFIGTKGIPNNIVGLKNALDIVIPAHLGVTYTFTFNPWESLTSRLWGEVSNMNWNDLRIWDEVI
ncbi:putative phage tail protein [Sporosarcina sp. FSL K6-1522]|uniref:putative phage tail protein n=1 Tax=Sporosarcina sp. FSL K6-1522 TaxID=2921554 RepID=UPI00315A1BE8